MSGTEGDVFNPVDMSGTVTPGHPVVWTTQGVVQDGGTPMQGSLTGVGILVPSGLALGITTAAVSSPFELFGLGWNTTNGNAQIILQNYGGAPPVALEYVINGVTYTFPGPGNGNVDGPNTVTTGDLAYFPGPSGTIIADSGILAANVVTGPANATSGDVAVFNGTTGKLISDSGLQLSKVQTQFTNIAALRGNVLSTFNLAVVLGYHSPTDGGEGMFWLNASDTTNSDNGGTIIVDAAGQRWYRLIDGISTSVKWFGAYGDNTHDDTSAIQSTINYVASQGGRGTVHLPADTYLLSSTALTCGTSGVSLRGDGLYATFLNFSNGSNDCIVFSGAHGATISGNGVYDLSLITAGKTGGRGIVFYFANYWFVERVNLTAIPNGIEAYVINTGTIRNVVMANVTGSWGIYYHAPADGSDRSDELNLHDVVVNCLYSGARGLLWDGWANTVNAYQFVALDANRGIYVLNSAGSNAFFPTFGEFVNSVVDGASARAVEIDGGAFFRFTGCELTNNSGSSGQGSADDYAFLVNPDTGHSETNGISLVNCLVGNCRIGAFVSAGKDITLIGCTFSAGVTHTANTGSAMYFASPGYGINVTGCKVGYFGNPNNWQYGMTIENGVLDLMANGNNLAIGVQTKSVNNLTALGSTVFVNNYTGAPPGPGVGPVVTFPEYSAPPTGPTTGETYFDTSLSKLQTWDGSAWHALW